MGKCFNLNKKGQALVEFMLVAFLLVGMMFSVFNVYKESYEVIKQKQWNN